MPRACDVFSFDPRPREGGDSPPRLRNPTRHCFDPRPREGGDLKIDRVLLRLVVSIHAPAKGATRSTRSTTAPFGVSIHAPAKGATREAVEGCGVLRFRSTPPRRGRRRITRRGSIQATVSIHAPAKGATAPGRKVLSVSMFRSTPPRRGRPCCHCRRLAFACFDPRPREG